jgi:hypothetical protein
MTLAISRPQIVRLPLGALPEAECDMHSTLVVPPRSALEPDEEIRERLLALERSLS